MSPKRFKLVPEMEGRSARWYARLRGTESQLEAWRRQAGELTAGLPSGASVLEVAPGPGYLAIEMARLGKVQVTGLDISRTFVEIATENAHAARVQVLFRHGDAARMPFESASFDLIVCQAAFKNFTEPVRALDEMHRVLRTGGTAVIDDLNKDASKAEIAREVSAMRLGWFNTLATKFVLGTMLRRRAYSVAQMRALVLESTFRTCDIRTQGIGLEVRVQKGAFEAAHQFHSRAADNYSLEGAARPGRTSPRPPRAPLE